MTKLAICLSVLFSLFVSFEDSLGKSQNHIGTWKGKSSFFQLGVLESKYNQKIRLILSQNGTYEGNWAITFSGETTISVGKGKYVFDYSQNPIWLDITESLVVKDTTIPRTINAIVDFVDKDIMRAEFSFREKRPEFFDDFLSIFFTREGVALTEQKARFIYNKGLISLNNGNALKAEKLFQTVVSVFLGTVTATEAIQNLHQMELFNVVVKNCNVHALADITNAITALEDYHIDYGTYADFIEKADEYGLQISEGVKFSILSADDKGYVVETFHYKGDKVYSAKGPDSPGSIIKTRDKK